ncbi:DNA recombination protein RmuC [candidate division GN15 bacterium]|nr:DNA recombination protein RmuC [candidate division GN15 bacterium]
MSLFDGAILLLLAATVALLVWIALRLGRDRSNERMISSLELLKAELFSRQADSALSLRDSLDKANQALNQRLAEGTSSLDRRMAVLGEIEHRLGELATQAANIEKIGQNIQSLSDLLRPPKSRGGVGELLLENLLSQILPPALFELQHRFPDGARVDAAVKLGDVILPIDAKFPMEAFERLQKAPDDAQLQKAFSRSLKLHIDAIADKYIRPAAKTTTFAVMYIPAEAVYYQLVTQTDQEGYDYALSRRVIPSSPGHLYTLLASVATLQAELHLFGGGVAEATRRLMAQVGDVVDTSERLLKQHQRVEGSLRQLSGAFDKARREAESIRNQLEKMRQPFDATSTSPDPDAPPGS